MGRVSGVQAERMRRAIDQVVAVGPGFLRGDIDADRMAQTMLQAVSGYTDPDPVEQQRPPDAEARLLHHVLAELRVCGSGYLAGRCDAACVARTITQIVQEFGQG